MEDELKLFDKLENCSEIQADDIKRGDHFLYTSSKFKEQGRKCVYAVCYGSSKGKLTCNTYVPKGEEKALEDWVLTITDKFKQYRFYKRDEPVTTKPVKPVKDKVPVGKPVKPKGTNPKGTQPTKPKPVEPTDEETVEHVEEETDYKGPYPKEEVFEKPKKRILKK